MSPLIAARKQIKTKPTILLVDDHEMVRKGIRALLEPDSRWDICGEAGNGEEALHKVNELHPDLVLMDLSMPIMDGIEATKRIKRLHPDAKVIIVSVHESPQIATEVIAIGASAYIVKSGSAEDLRTTIAMVLGTV